jgi:hypothetical protein
MDATGGQGFKYAAIGIVALGIGVWLGINWTERAVRPKATAATQSDLSRDIQLRADLVGKWIEEKPVKLGSVPLLTIAILDLRGDGTFEEAAWLLTPERSRLQGMTWTTAGNWRVRGGEVLFDCRESHGPTTRPTGAYHYFALVVADELEFLAMKSPDRGSESRTYRRLLAQRLTNADLDAARLEHDDGPSGED